MTPLALACLLRFAACAASLFYVFIVCEPALLTTHVLSVGELCPSCSMFGVRMWVLAHRHVLALRLNAHYVIRVVYVQCSRAFSIALCTNVSKTYLAGKTRVNENCPTGLDIA